MNSEFHLKQEQGTNEWMGAYTLIDILFMIIAHALIYILCVFAGVLPDILNTRNLITVDQ